MKYFFLSNKLYIIIIFFGNLNLKSQTITYPIVETGVLDFYDNYSIISEPASDQPFYGQDATYQGTTPSYTDNPDGTVTDNVTGLMWQKDMGEKISCANAVTKADTLTLGQYNDWRVPTIKELYSLILFTGMVSGTVPYERFIDTAYFNQPLGDTTIGERLIDAQTWSATQYKSTTMNGDSTVFGVNFLDGRIKGYPKYKPGSNNTTPNTMYFRMVRGNSHYGINRFADNGDGTVTDSATGLMWQKADDGNSRDWEDAMSYAENLTLANYSDWRLPNAKELQSLLDYSRCPYITNSPAIDPVFSTTEINDPDGNTGQYPYFWTGTSHLDGTNPYTAAVYVAFGEAQGKMNNTLMDVHGAGSQRSDPKTGDPADYPDYFGPQGDVRYVFNYVRCVRDTSGSISIKENSSQKKNINSRIVGIYPNPSSGHFSICFDKTYKNFSIAVLNTLGKKAMWDKHNNAKRIDINLSDMPAGVYLLKITMDGNSMMKKIIKR